jgi:shikimate kinase/3-dehydroquinate synthase
LAQVKLVLVGFMGAGKSTAGRRAAEALGVGFADADELIEARIGEPIASFFESRGEPAFREVEEAVVCEVLDRPDPMVVALGGGALGSEAVAAEIRRHVAVWLEVDDDAAWERARESARPLARDRDAFAGLHAERLPLYESAARARVPSTAGPRGVDRALRSAMALARPEVPQTVRMLWADIGDGYPVFVGSGALRAAGALWPQPGRCFVVADEMAQALHGEMLLDALADHVEVAGTVTVSPGERHKSLSEAERVLRELARAGMQRSDALAAFGGGVVGDLAGFCAATYQRGVPVVQVPTTVVAQVDSAYGGKTGVDLPEAKNYVGAFHQPVAVLTDPGLLTTLPDMELQAGFAEVIKTGLLAGGRLWDRVRALPPLGQALRGDIEVVARLVEGCAHAKLSVVARDERESGVRACLNLGHTFGHALEAAEGYEAHRHGEAVALGLLVALRLSELEAGLDESVRFEVLELLERHGLPRSFEGPGTDELLAAAALDKKRRGSRQNFVLLAEPGEPVIGAEVPRQELVAAIEEIRA